MLFDGDVIQSVYESYNATYDALIRRLNRPLTLTEKLLHLHMDGRNSESVPVRGVSYENFYPDRVAMQDATAYA